jgi:hypothetical protein
MARAVSSRGAGIKPRRSTPPPARDQHESAFTRILASLVSRLPGGRGAALVDREGETVDYAGVFDPYDLKIAAAHWRIVLDETRCRPPLAATSFIGLRASRASYRVHTLPDGYALVIAFARGGGFGGWQRAVAACCSDLGREAAWSQRDSPARIAGTQPWYAVQVQTDARRRPIALGSGSSALPIEILGSVASGMARRERGWRVRIAGDLEATLVREPGRTGGGHSGGGGGDAAGGKNPFHAAGNWYVDDPHAASPEAVAQRGASTPPARTLQKPREMARSESSNKTR